MLAARVGAALELGFGSSLRGSQDFLSRFQLVASGDFPLPLPSVFVPDCVGATASLLDDSIRQRRPHEMPIEELADHLGPPLDSGRTCQDGGDASGLVP